MPVLIFKSGNFTIELLSDTTIADDIKLTELQYTEIKEHSTPMDFWFASKENELKNLDRLEQLGIKLSTGFNPSEAAGIMEEYEQLERKIEKDQSLDFLNNLRDVLGDDWRVKEQMPIKELETDDVLRLSLGKFLMTELKAGQTNYLKLREIEKSVLSRLMESLSLKFPSKTNLFILSKK